MCISNKGSTCDEQRERGVLKWPRPGSRHAPTSLALYPRRFPSQDHLLGYHHPHQPFMLEISPLQLSVPGQHRASRCAFSDRGSGASPWLSMTRRTESGGGGWADRLPMSTADIKVIRSVFRPVPVRCSSEDRDRVTVHGVCVTASKPTECVCVCARRGLHYVCTCRYLCMSSTERRKEAKRNPGDGCS